ncbi:MAG: hypothetical protein ACLFPD_03825, partial [Desulfosudaceae bacterium]
VRENRTDTFHFFLKKEKAVYFRAGLNHIDLGIAMCHFQLAAAESGCTGHWRHLPPDPSRLPANIFYTMSWVGDCAIPGRGEHGSDGQSPQANPGTPAVNPERRGLAR